MKILSNNQSINKLEHLQEDINKLLGDEANKIDIVNGKYKETTEELISIFEEDKKESTLLTAELYKKRTPWKKFVSCMKQTARTRCLSSRDLRTM